MSSTKAQILTQQLRQYLCFCTMRQETTLEGCFLRQETTCLLWFQPLGGAPVVGLLLRLCVMRVCVNKTFCVSICTCVLVKQVNGVAAPVRQYLYFCTRKASTLSTGRVGPRVRLTKNAVKRRETHKR
jgi:hypothetical protein